MSPQGTALSLGFTGDHYAAGTHMCLIFNDENERRKIIGKYLESGMVSGERVAYFADNATISDMDAWLKDMDIDVKAIKKDDLSITEAESTYCPSGKFVPEDMLDTLRTFYAQSKQDNYPACRVSGEMSWALKGIPGSERLMEYEALVNDVLVTHPVTAICQYDARRFDGATILECLEVHPYMIVRGQIVHNPYYMTTQAFLNKKGQSR